MPVLRGHNRGDQLVRVRVVTPEKLTREQKELFEKLAELESKEKSGFEKVKDFFS